MPYQKGVRRRELRRIREIRREIEPGLPVPTQAQVQQVLSRIGGLILMPAREKEEPELLEESKAIKDFEELFGANFRAAKSKLRKLIPRGRGTVSLFDLYRYVLPQRIKRQGYAKITSWLVGFLAAGQTSRQFTIKKSSPRGRITIILGEEEGEEEEG